MNDEMTELARRAVACEGWRWMEGMSTTEGDIVVAVGCDTITLRNDGVMHAENSGVLPDFDGPATRGCLLELVREAVESVTGEDVSVMDFLHGLDFSDFESAVEGLVAALEAADD